MSSTRACLQHLLSVVIALSGAAVCFGADTIYEAQIVARSGDVFGNRVAEQFDCADINNHGDDAFVAKSTLGDILFSTSGVEVFSRSVIDGTRVDTFSFPHINDAGDVAFLGGHEDSAVGFLDGIFTQDEVIAIRGSVYAHRN
ncbi:MAG: hypothetical protein WD875_08770 [Pirellulales bacterium]